MHYAALQFSLCSSLVQVSQPVDIDFGILLLRVAGRGQSWRQSQWKWRAIEWNETASTNCV